MTNQMYVSAKTAFLLGDIDLVADTIKVVLVDTADYTVNISTHDFLNDVPSGARVSTITLSGKSVTAGVFDAADGSFPSVTGDQSEALIIYKDTGVESTSPLILYIDQATGLAVAPNGNSITLTWPSSGIFSLA